MSQDELWLRQQQLISRSAQLRLALAHQAQVLKRPLAMADQVHEVLHWLRRHPQWPLAALLALLIRRPRRLLTWSARAWWTWKMLRRARVWLAPLRQPLP